MKTCLFIFLIALNACGESTKLSDSGNAVRKNKENSRIAQQNLGGYQPVVSYTPFQPTNQPTHQPATGGTAQQPKQAPVVRRPSKNCLKGSQNYGAKGPYSVGRLNDFSGYTVFYPREMESQNCLFPWIVWGNGTTQRGIGYYGAWDQHLASWGIVVIHSHADGGGGLSGAGPMKAGVDIAYKLASGKMRGKLTAKGGVAGHSQGGIGAQLVAASKSEIGAVVDLQGGGMANHNKPALMLTGKRDFMEGSVNSAYGMLRGPAILYNYSDADHIMSPMSKVEYRASAAQFFRWVLADDMMARKAFIDCVFCNLTTPKYKNF